MLSWKNCDFETMPFFTNVGMADKSVVLNSEEVNYTAISILSTKIDSVYQIEIDCYDTKLNESIGYYIFTLENN